MKKKKEPCNHRYILLVYALSDKSVRGVKCSDCGEFLDKYDTKVVGTSIKVSLKSKS